MRSPVLAVEGQLPPLTGATGWLNTAPLTPADLRGRVVLVDFWTYTCINWLRTLPHIRAWSDKYRDAGLAVLGVHTPEFEFEHDLDNVRRAVADMRIDYAVAVDSDYAIWRAFGNMYWPALYFADAHGRIRRHQFGEGDYAQSETTIQQLLSEAGLGAPATLGSVEGDGIEAPADWAALQSPETYLGYERGERLVSPRGAVLDARHLYAAPVRLGLNEWAMSGEWNVGRQAATLAAAGGQIMYRFSARDLHLVMRPIAGPVRFRVLIDGRPPGDDHGLDVDDQGNGVVTQPRLHQLFRQRGRVTERTFEITFLDPDVQAYVFTFG
jgi:thiol-disulfide isomerase/thioredoxin